MKTYGDCGSIQQLSIDTHANGYISFLKYELFYKTSRDCHTYRYWIDTYKYWNEKCLEVSKNEAEMQKSKILASSAHDNRHNMEVDAVVARPIDNCATYLIIPWATSRR